MCTNLISGGQLAAELVSKVDSTGGKSGNACIDSLGISVDRQLPKTVRWVVKVENFLCQAVVDACVIVPHAVECPVCYE